VRENVAILVLIPHCHLHLYIYVRCVVLFMYIPFDSEPAPYIHCTDAIVRVPIHLVLFCYSFVPAVAWCWRVLALHLSSSVYECPTTLPLPVVDGLCGPGMRWRLHAGLCALLFFQRLWLVCRLFYLLCSLWMLMGFLLCRLPPYPCTRMAQVSPCMEVWAAYLFPANEMINDDVMILSSINDDDVCRRWYKYY
jgi:hypothetical protein